MNRLNDMQLMEVNGGTISGSVMQYAAKFLTTIFDLGRALGSSIRRIYSDTACSIEKID